MTRNSKRGGFFEACSSSQGWTERSSQSLHKISICKRQKSQITAMLGTPLILLFPWDAEYSQSHSLGLSKPSPTLGFGCFVWIHLCIRQWGRVNRRPDWAYWKILPTFGFFLYFSGTVPGKLTYQYPDNLEALRLLAESSPASAKTYFVAFSSRSCQFYTNWYNHCGTDRNPRPIHLTQTQQPNQVPNKFPTKH